MKLKLLLLPTLVLSLLVPLASGADVPLAWDASTSTNISGYKVYVGSNSRTYGSPVTIGNQTTYTISGLSSGTWYFAVTAFDTAGNESDFSNEVSKVIASADTTAPTISGVASSSITNAAATITWTTNEASDSQVEYGIATSYGSSTTLAAGMVTSHSLSLSGLAANTTYHYRVLSKDAAGNKAVSGDNIFTTSAPPDTTAPIISSVTASSITTTSAIISWTTNEASDSQIQYGTTTSYGSSTTLATGMLTIHSQTLNGLSAGNIYHYRVLSKDAAGNAAVSADYTLTTAVPPDTTPPVISSVASSNITTSGATISWTTNEASDSQIQYGTSTSYGSSSALASARVTAHSQTLSALTAGTTYHYRVLSKDAAGNQAVTGDYTFVTSAAPDTTSPVISSVASSNITTSGATISWTTNEASDSQIQYGTSTSYGSSSALASAMVTSHSVILNGLASGTTYHYRVRSQDAAGNAALSSDFTFNTLSSIDITSGLVAAYAFDEGTGTSSVDLSGQGNVASLYSTTWTTGKYGKALSFNGFSSYASAGTAGLPGISQPQTISCWVNLGTKSPSIRSIVSLANATTSAAIKLGSKNTQIGTLKYNNSWLTTAKLPSLKAWHHFAFVLDGVQNRLYIDGVLAASSTVTSSAAPVTSLLFGRWLNRAEYFTGSIDDLRIYSRALSIAELQLAMNTPIATSSASPSPALASAMLLSYGTDETNSTLETAPAVQSSSQPAIDLQLDRQIYRLGDTVRASALWISNPSAQNLTVEPKTWIALPQMQPLSLDTLNGNETLSLTSGSNLNYGATSILNVSPTSPSGTGLVGARLLDPVTGEILSEDLNMFAISSKKMERIRLRPLSRPTPQVTLQRAYSDSGMEYTIANNGSLPVDLEVKIWMAGADGGATPVFASGADGTLTLPAGATITLYPQIASPDLRARILEAATGDILGEQ